MGKRSNPTLIELDDDGVGGFAKRRQVVRLPMVVSSSQNAAIVLLSIRDSAELVVPEVVDSMLQQRKNHDAADGEFFSVTDDENDDGRHSPLPHEIKSSNSRQPRPPMIACALREPAFTLGGPITHTNLTVTKLSCLGKPLPPPPLLAPHLTAKVKPINLMILSSS
jgi:hypothetical protein